LQSTFWNIATLSISNILLFDYKAISKAYKSVSMYTRPIDYES